MDHANGTQYVYFQPNGKSIDIETTFMVYWRPEAQKLSCFIPAFNIYFTAADEEMMDRKSQAMTQMYFNHFLHHNTGKKTGLQALGMQLHKLGFKAPNDALVIKRLMTTNKIDKTRFKSATNFAPAEFNESKAIRHTEEFAIAD